MNNILKSAASCCITVLLTLLSTPCLGAGRTIEADGTYLYAEKDGQQLFLDVYNPVGQTTIDGRSKPSIIFIFGGGFSSGRRDDPGYMEWFAKMTEEGYRIISIDYRLGMKGYKGKGYSPKLIKTEKKAITMAVEDLFSATSFLIDNASSLGIEAGNLVVSGSSAGAITALQAEYEICRRSPITDILPESFNYAGVMSFSGAIFSTKGPVKYNDAGPCPSLLFHGTEDKIVPYKGISVLTIHFTGSDKLSKIYKSKGFNYRIYRFSGHSHEIASSMLYNVEREIEFLEENVMRGSKQIVDTILEGKDIPVPEWATAKLGNFY